MKGVSKPVTDVFTGAREEREDITSFKGAYNVRLSEQTDIRPPRPRDIRRMQNFLLVWLDSSIDEVNDIDCSQTITKLQQVINVVDTFTDVDECIDFITDVQYEQIILILSETFVQTIVSIIHEIPQASFIYILSRNKIQHGEWLKQWPKIKDVFADIACVSEELTKVAQECEQNSVSISFVPSDYELTHQNLKRGDQSFMYNQVLKEILLTTGFEQQHFNDFFMYCREQFVNNTLESKNVDKLEKEYYNHTPVWWYTNQSFLYSMLNRALRHMEVKILIKLSFFIRDLYQHIAHLHSAQYSDCNSPAYITVYRGQGLLIEEFKQLLKTKGGLLSFNNFLSTSRQRDVSLSFAESSGTSPNLAGVLFKITVDITILSTPFANVSNDSYYQSEEEILFSMYSIFRIGQIQQIDENARLWQIDLMLTSGTDPQLHLLTECIRKESFPHQKGCYRLGSFMITLAQFNKAREVFEIILEQTDDENETANIYHMLGVVKYNEGEYAEAITFYEKSIEIMQRTLPSTHPDLASSYRNIGTVYDKMGEYSKALSYHEKALKTYQNIVPSNHFTFPASGDNTSLTDEMINNASRATLSFERAFAILQQTLPRDDLSLATLYERHGSVYEQMGDNVKALSFYERALKIKEKHLPSNHPSLATSYAYHGGVYKKMGDSSTAHSFNQRALDIGQRSLPADHPDLQAYRQNVENEEQEP